GGAGRRRQRGGVRRRRRGGRHEPGGALGDPSSGVPGHGHRPRAARVLRLGQEDGPAAGAGRGDGEDRRRGDRGRGRGGAGGGALPAREAGGPGPEVVGGAHRVRGQEGGQVGGGEPADAGRDGCGRRRRRGRGGAGGRQGEDGGDEGAEDQRPQHPGEQPHAEEPRRHGPTSGSTSTSPGWIT